MEFANRKACVEHYQAQFDNLPRYMIEMALDYDLATSDGAASNEKPLTGKEKRRLKQAKQEHVPIERELTKQIQEALKEGKRKYSSWKQRLPRRPWKRSCPRRRRMSR